MQEARVTPPATTPKPRSRTWLWTLLIIVGALIILGLATFLALRIVADNTAHAYKQSLASYETSLAKSFNGSTDGATLESAMSDSQPPVLAPVPVPAASSAYQDAKQQSGTVASTVTALKKSVDDYANLNGFMKNYLDLENQEQALVSQIKLSAAGMTHIDGVQEIVAKKQALVSTTAAPSESTEVMSDLTEALSDKTAALARLTAAARTGNYGGFNAATTALNAASAKEEAALGTLDEQASSLQDSLNQNVTAFNQLVAKVVK